MKKPFPFKPTEPDIPHIPRRFDPGIPDAPRE